MKPIYASTATADFIAARTDENGNAIRTMKLYLVEHADHLSAMISSLAAPDDAERLIIPRGGNVDAYLGFAANAFFATDDEPEHEPEPETTEDTRKVRMRCITQRDWGDIMYIAGEAVRDEVARANHESFWDAVDATSWVIPHEIGMRSEWREIDPRGREIVILRSVPTDRHRNIINTYKVFCDDFTDDCICCGSHWYHIDDCICAVCVYH